VDKPRAESKDPLQAFSTPDVMVQLSRHFTMQLPPPLSRSASEIPTHSYGMLRVESWPCTKGEKEFPAGRPSGMGLQIPPLEDSVQDEPEGHAYWVEAAVHPRRVARRRAKQAKGDDGEDNFMVLKLGCVWHKMTS